VNDSNFQIEQQCPQCGAPIILDETDRILTCGFCRIRVYLATEDHFRFYFPPKEGIAEPLYFLPFWRIKGLSYTIGESEILSKYFDTNFLAMDTDLLPHSLGLRPQAMKLFFVGSGDVSGRFIASSGETGENLLKKYRNRSPGKYDREIFIGERKSVIYAPVYFADSHVYDAILKKPLLDSPANTPLESLFENSPAEKWHVEFIPLLCPQCGADLPGEKDALIVFCKNCHSAWNPGEKNFPQVRFLSWLEKGEDVIYLPFWQIQARVSGLQLETYADLIQVANLPKAPAEIWMRMPFYFQIPAFKVNPSLFLRWCRQMTVQPTPPDLGENLPAQRIYPVTLPVSEALESTFITLISLMADKRHRRETASALHIELDNQAIVLHPFRMSAGEWIHAKLGFSMNRTSLNLGINL